METYLLHDVFTPTRPAQLTFVERKSIQDKLVDALRTPGKQLVVYGQTGSGKSTLLLNKLQQLYENHITTRCFTGLSFDQIMLDAFDQLDKYYKEEVIKKSQQKISASIASEYSTLKLKFDNERTIANDAKEKRIVPPQLTPQRLATFMGEAKCCWVLEDFHKIDNKEKQKLSQVMKIFMDMAFEYPEVKTIAIGAVGTAREVVQYDQEMRNRVSEIAVQLMSDDEIIEILQKGSQLLHINFSKSLSDDIVLYSNGLASVSHQLCLNMCLHEDIQETCKTVFTFNDDSFKKSVLRYVEEESDTIKDLFDRALRRKQRKGKFDNCRIILRALAQSNNQDGITRGEILQIIHDAEPNYPGSNLNVYLKELTNDGRGSILRYDAASGRYLFNNPFHRVFALAVFAQEKQALPKKTSEPLNILGNVDIQDALLEAIKMTTEFINERYELKLKGK